MRLSIATKIFLAFTLILLTFGAVLIFQIAQMRAIYNEVELINAGYVPLSLTLNDVRSDLRSYSVVLNEKDPDVLKKNLLASRSLYNFPDQIEIKLARAQQHARTQLQQPRATEEIDFLTTLERDLAETRTLNTEFRERSDRFADALRAGRTDEASTLQADLRRSERRLATRVRASQRNVREQIDRALLRAQSGESSAFGAAVALSFVALLISAAILLIIQLTVRPLRLLAEGARRIASGDYRPTPTFRARDEIGVLASEFNHMVAAIADRDGALRDQSAALVKSERLAAIGELATKVTHELRNPLSTIRLNAELLSDELAEHGLTPDTEPQRTLHTIIEEVERLGVLTEDYLRFARLPDPNPTPGDLNALVEAVLDFQRDDLEASGVTLDLRLTHNLPPVLIDAPQLRRALLNLIRNAREAMEQEPTRTLTLRTWDASPDHPLQPDTPTVALSIHDTGIGIPEAQRARIFEPFFSLKAKGTGLGLPLTLQIVEEHHGKLLCDSTPGEGTRFTLLLPASTPTKP